MIPVGNDKVSSFPSFFSFFKTFSPPFSKTLQEDKKNKTEMFLSMILIKHFCLAMKLSQL